MKNDSQLSAFALRDKPTIKFRDKPRVIHAPWTDERITELRRLQMDGLSTSQIAEKLGSVSRNAVIGKLHRLGMTGPRSGIPTGGKPKLKRGNRIGSNKGDSYWRKTRPLDNGRRVFLRDFNPKKVSAPVHLPMPAADDVARISYAEFLDPLAEVAIPRNACRWPVGEPMTGFCGCEAVPGKPYCGGHLARSVGTVQVTSPRPYQTTALSVRSLKDVEGFLA